MKIDIGGQGRGEKKRKAVPLRGGGEGKKGEYGLLPLFAGALQKKKEGERLTLLT